MVLTVEEYNKLLQVSSTPKKVEPPKPKLALGSPIKNIGPRVQTLLNTLSGTTPKEIRKVQQEDQGQEKTKVRAAAANADTAENEDWKKELKELVSKIDRLEQNINSQQYNYQELTRKLNNFELQESKENTVPSNVERGLHRPFRGYIEAEVRIPYLTENPFFVPVLVRKLSNSDSDSEIPVIIGTNVIRSCKEMVSELDCSSNIPEVWNLAFKSMCKKDLKVVDSWEPETEEVSSVTKGENSDIFVETIGSKINRQNLTENELIFPEAVKAVCQAAQIDREILPLAESLVITDTGQLGEELPELESQELSTVNWQQEQDDDPVIGRLKIIT
uniref:Uncharacterized protein n=1 Tax=Magallana gigas TaxID=29159 RepID=A0A8W8NDM8_MAGGI